MAPRSKLGKLLTCFYCGRRSTTRFDGKMKHFDCSKCEATNFLDAAGDITDPPVATQDTPQAPIYARRDRSPKFAPTEQIFCRKCTTNQHLTVSTLAQYFPDDPEDPEYAARERGYYKFRRNLEKRYPQCCSDCEPKVRTQLGKANYNAKTDWLRRQLDYSSQVRALVTRTSANYAASVGKWLWLTSLYLQLLWHMMLIQGAVIISNELDPNSWTVLAARAAGVVLAYLPSAERIISWSFWLTLLSFWWNPKWVESWRGFVRHLYGFQHYYAYQAMILSSKFPAYLNVSMMNTPRAQRLTVQVVVHGFMALFMYYLYRSARRSIRTDNRQLWLPRPGSILATPPSTIQQSYSQPEPTDNGEKTMGDILDDILNEPSQKPVLEPQPYTPHTAKAYYTTNLDDLPMTATKGSPNPFRSRTQTPSTAPPPYTPYTPHTPHTPYMPRTPFNAEISPVEELGRAHKAGSNPFKDLHSTPVPTPRPDTSGSNLGFGGLSLSDRSQSRPQTRAQTRALQSGRDSMFQQLGQQPFQQQLAQRPGKQPDQCQLFQRAGQQPVQQPIFQQSVQQQVQQPLQLQQSRQPQLQQPYTDYDEEMEWTHSQSQHRAFSTYKPGEEKRGFNAAPVADNPNKVFWAKIPPKPITPAQRVFNPPGQPVIRSNPIQGPPITNPYGFKGAEGTSTGRMMFRKLEPLNTRPLSTEFAQASFLPPPPRDDRDTLVDIFKRGLSLSDGSEDEDDGAGNSPQGGQSLASKLRYSLLGLCLAVVGHLVYQQVVHP